MSDVSGELVFTARGAHPRRRRDRSPLLVAGRASAQDGRTSTGFGASRRDSV